MSLAPAAACTVASTGASLRWAESKDDAIVWRRLDLDEGLGPVELTLDAGGAIGAPAVAWDGTGLEVAWNGGGQLAYARVSVACEERR